MVRRLRGYVIQALQDVLLILLPVISYKLLANQYVQHFFEFDIASVPPLSLLTRIFVKLISDLI